MGARRDMRSGVGQIPKRGHRSPNPEIIGNDAVSQRHVEIATDQDPTTIQVTEVLEPWNIHHGGPSGRFVPYFRAADFLAAAFTLAFLDRRVPTILVRSTRRVE